MSDHELAGAGVPSPPLQPPRPAGEVVYVCDRIGERSETFITNEVRTLRRYGVDPTLVALYPVRDADPTAGDLEHTTLPSALGSPARLAVALVTVLATHPIGLVRSIWLGLGRRHRMQAHALAKAILLVGARRGRVPERFHAHFARASASVAMHAATISGCRFSFTAHAIDIYSEPFDVDRKLDRADVSVAVCAYNVAYTQRTWPGHGRLALVRCGVDPDRFRRSTPYAPTEMRILSVGRLVEKKGFDDLIRALVLLREAGVDAAARIIGSGPQEADLRSLIAEHELGDRVTLAGSASPAEVRAALEQATVFVLPCVVAASGDRDAQPVVIKEAMAMELPVVTTDEVGCPEMVVDRQTGLVVPPRSPQALAEALAWVAARVKEDPEALVAMGRAGRRRVIEEFTLGGEVAKLLEAWAAAP